MKLRIGVAVVFSVAVMVWLAALSEDWKEAFPLRGQKGDYYNLLVDGFQEGHLYMKAEVHPDQLSPDEQVRRRAPYLLDASLYDGRYYLYFGVVPALALFWPYTALTGHDCPQNLAVLLAVVAGFLVSLRLYTDARARYFPTARGWFDFTAVGLLAFGSGSPVLLVSGGMYEVALSWGYLWIAVMTWCLFRALHSDRSSLGWLAAASVAYGLGVGSRPTIFLLGPLLPVVALLVSPRGSNPDRGRRLLRLAAAVAIPAGVIGLGLMAYNYARFGNPLEFGLNHQVNALAGNGHPLQSAAYVISNLRWYYLTPSTFSAFFPYLFPHSSYPMPTGYYAGSEPTHGQFVALLLAAVCALAVAVRKPAVPRLLGWFLALLAFSFAAMLLVTSTFPYRSTRYMVDFQPQLVLLLVLVGGVVSLNDARPRLLPRLGSAALFGIGTSVWLACLLIGLQFLNRFSYSHANAFRFLSYYGNYPASLLARLGWHHYGPLRFKVVFKQPAKPVMETLVATGAPGYKDVLYAAQYPGGLADFILTHDGYGGARSSLVRIEYGRPYEVILDMGSLYPPADGDYFPHWAKRPREFLRSFGRMTLDGVEVIRARQSFYESSPGLLDFGQATGRPELPFSGQISQIERLSLRGPADLAGLVEMGVWRFEIDFPPPTELGGQPLLSSGVTGRGNLLFLRNRPDGTLEFCMDFWGAGGLTSPPIARPAGGRHVLEVFVGAQVNRQAALVAPTADPGALQAATDVLRIWLDGQPVWTASMMANADSYDLVGVGTNTQGFSTALSAYKGTFLRQPLSPTELRAAVERNLAPGLP